MKNIFKKNTTSTKVAACSPTTVEFITPYNMSKEQMQTFSNTTFTMSCAMSAASLIVGGIGLARQAKKNARLKAEEKAAKATEAES